MSEFTGIWLPAPILRIPGLNLTEKVLLAQVILLSRTGECTATNPTLADNLDTTETTISTTLSRLSKKEFVHIESGREQGNKRKIYPSLKSLMTLFKNLNEGDRLSLKVLKDMFNFLKEAIEDSSRPYLNILYTLFKNLKEAPIYIRLESKEESKRESKAESFKVVDAVVNAQTEEIEEGTFTSAASPSNTVANSDAQSPTPYPRPGAASVSEEFDQLEFFSQKLADNDEFVASTARQFAKTLDWVRDQIYRFFNEQRALGNSSCMIWNEARKHCYSWIRIQAEKSRDDENRNKKPSQSNASAPGKPKYGSGSAKPAKRTAFIRPGTLRRDSPSGGDADAEGYGGPIRIDVE